MQQKILVGVAGLLLLAGVVLGYLYYSTTTTLKATKAELQTSTEAASDLSASLATTETERAQLEEALAAERARNKVFEEQIDTISGTVGRLDKLSRTDPELLQKYSKVYFLNENFVPSSLDTIDEAYRFNPEKVEEIHGEVSPHLKRLLAAAKDDGIDLLIASSYRSFGRQGALKASYTVRYGSGANAFSAEQGYSEHQLGTTIDFTTEAVGGTFAGFDTTEAYEWLTEHAYTYGFVLSYPKGNTYYQYEPWHWRFVSRDLADDLHDDGKHFYDLDQRTIDPYLVDFFE